MDPVDQVFTLLDKWRHLPKYQLERRADIFFGLYLHSFLQDRFAVRLRPQLVPEFPIHLRTIGRNVVGESSCNVDFLAVTEDISFAFFVELKTDGLSRREEQDGYLKDSQRVGLPALLNGVVQITKATQQAKKYFHLLLLLEEAGLLVLPPAIRVRHEQGNIRGLTVDLAAIRPAISSCPIRIIYLQPIGQGENEIGFDEFGAWMDGFSDPFSQRFRRSLAGWSSSAAGSANHS